MSLRPLRCAADHASGALPLRSGWDCRANRSTSIAQRHSATANSASSPNAGDRGSEQILGHLTTRSRRASTHSASRDMCGTQEKAS